MKKVERPNVEGATREIDTARCDRCDGSAGGETMRHRKFVSRLEPSDLFCCREHFCDDQLHICRSGAVIHETSSQSEFAMNGSVGNVNTATFNNALQNLRVVLAARPKANRAQL